MYDVVLVKYSEIALKGENRSYFEKKLTENIKKSFKRNGIEFEKVKRERSYIIIYTKAKEFDVANALKSVFGIANFSFAYTCAKDMEKIKKIVLSKFSQKNKKTFKVEASRQDKTFPVNSMEIGRIIGEAVYNKYKIKGDMKNPEALIYVDILDKAYVHFEKIQGLGNLPVGSSGNVLSLLSGGIDSPVAAWMSMKRGCYVSFINFYKDKKELKKIKSLLSVLGRYQGKSKIYLIPFERFQMATADIFPNYEMIIFRRFMLKIAERVAIADGASALVLGDNIGQVASQTLENLKASDLGINIPIIRPLAGFSKDEIIGIAKQIESYNISIIPQKDCCSIVSQHPATKPKIDKILNIESKMNMEKLIQQTLKDMETMIV